MSAGPLQALDPQAADAEEASFTTPAETVIPVASFLDRVAGVLSAGLPERVWLAATVVDVRASAAGHTLELSDPLLERGGATLRVFLASGTLGTIRRDLGVTVDPLLLAGMTTCLLVAPAFTRRWHLGGRVEALGRDVAASLRARLLERVIATLQREGIWNRQRALPPPRDVTRLAVIHPAGAAGWGDIAGELGRWAQAGLLRVRSHPTPFEGEQAGLALAAALRAATEPLDGDRPDLVLLVRGGGARISLAVLDEEGVARAILGCPVPVVCGAGHARDQSLVDRVAWRTMDTPSKALVLVAEILRGAAHRARTSWQAIRAAVAIAMLTEAGRLAERRQAVIAALIRAHALADRQLGDLWSRLQAESRAGVARLAVEHAALDRHLATVVLGAPQRLAAGEQALHQLLQAGLVRAAALLAGADDGGALLARAESRVGTMLEREGVGLQRQDEAVEAALTHQLERAAAALERVLAAVDVADPSHRLAQGFVLVTDEHGHPLPSRAAAAAHRRLRLCFSDGALSVGPAG